MKERPTETITGVTLGAAVYGFETQIGLPPVVSGVIAVVVAFGPVFISGIVDALRSG